MARARLLTLGVLCALLLPAGAHAASVSLAAPTDPRVDATYTITATGTGGTGRKLYVGSYPGGCPSDSYSVSKLSGSGVSVPAGAFSKTFTDTRTGPGPTNVTYCAYVATDNGATPDASTQLIFAVRKANASVSISAPADPRVDEPYTFTVSGNTENDRKLFVGSYPGGCPSDSYSVSKLSGSGVTVPAGAFSKTFTDTRTGPGPTNVIYCAYVATDNGANPHAVTQLSFVIRKANASVAVTASANPRVELPFTFTVTGNTENARKLFVGSYPGGCPSDSYSVSKLSGSGVAIPAGTFNKTFTDIRTTAGSVIYCAYIATDNGASPDAVTQLKFSVRQANASVSMSASADPQVDTPYTVTISGSAENDRKLFFGSYPGGCPSDSYSVSKLSGSGVAIPAGVFTKTFTDTRASPGPANVIYCAYVATDNGAAPDATTQLTVTVRDPNHPSPTSTGVFSIFLPAATTPNKANKQDLTSPAAETALAAELTRRYGASYSAGDADDWLRCPDEELGIFDEDDTTSALCEFRFFDVTAGAWRHGEASISQSGSGPISFDISSTLFSKKVKRCSIRRNLLGYKPQVLNRTLHADGYVSCYDGPASMVRDLNNLKPGIRRVSFHGTNRAGFGTAATFRCKLTASGARRTARCENGLGDRFVYTWTLRTVKPKPVSKKPTGSAPSNSSNSDSSSANVGTCADTTDRNFPVAAGDPRDGDGDGIACET